MDSRRRAFVIIHLVLGWLGFGLKPSFKAAAAHSSSWPQSCGLSGSVAVLACNNVSEVRDCRDRGSRIRCDLAKVVVGMSQVAQKIDVPWWHWEENCGRIVMIVLQAHAAIASAG